MSNVHVTSPCRAPHHTRGILIDCHSCMTVCVLPSQVLNVAYMAVFTRVLGRFLQSSVPFYSARFMVRIRCISSRRCHPWPMAKGDSRVHLSATLHPETLSRCTESAWSAAQVWEISTTISSLVGGGLLQLLEGSALGLWHLRAIGTRVGNGACILGGSRCAYSDRLHLKEQA